ncbi:MAG TPA: hypothetical protein VFV87_02895 [Pirellulaceae bacterium]|nr:hypothetical protein [Pirellulaceae bacterium]
MNSARSDDPWPAGSYEKWVEEPLSDVLVRANPFQREFLQRLLAEVPALAQQLVLRRVRRRFHPDVELYSEPDNGISADFEHERSRWGFSIDAETNVICVWNMNGQGEYADWNGTGRDSQGDAIRQIREFIARDP